MAVTQKDTTFTKIFVGGLPYHTTDQSLREFFEQFGDIEEAVVITDRQTGKSRGYGFVTMSDRAAAERACKDPNPIIDGRKANVNLAYLGAKPRAFPFALKAGIPGVINTSQFGLPPMMYAAAPTTATGGYITAATPGSAAAFQMAAAAAHSPMSQQTAIAATAGQFDYAAYPTAIPTMANYEAQYAYMNPAAYTMSYSGLQQPLGLTAAHYQPQPIQAERMQ